MTLQSRGKFSLSWVPDYKEDWGANSWPPGDPGLPTMSCYAIFGGSLSSEIDLPELRAGNEREPRWTLHVGRSESDGDNAELLGRTAVMPGVDVGLCRVPKGLRLTYGDIGSFDIVRGGEEIV